jgi:hypothetical protein
MIVVCLREPKVGRFEATLVSTFADVPTKPNSSVIPPNMRDATSSDRGRFSAIMTPR